MELPDDVLQLIKEYSMPITNPAWRKLHKMTNYKYYDEFYTEYHKQIRDIVEYHTILYERYNPYRYKPVFCETRYRYYQLIGNY